MKRFLVYLLTIVVTVSLGFAIFYLVRDNEVISVSSASIYKDVGQRFTIDVDHRHPKKTTTISITPSDTSIVDYDKDKNEFEAKNGGVARINFRTTNVKFRNIWCDVIVGDGTIESPFYISTAEQLAAIGMGSEITDAEGHPTGVFSGATGYTKYASNLCYKLVADIDVSSVNGGYWVPLRTFSGRFDGNGFTISNININETEYLNTISAVTGTTSSLFNNVNVGFMQEISANAVVYNIKFDNFSASGTYTNFGSVAAINRGTIERIEIKDATYMLSTEVFGGIVAINQTSENIASAVYERYIARVDRCSVNFTMGATIALVDNTATTVYQYNYNTIGGIIGKNIGGALVYCYSTGDVYLGMNSEIDKTKNITYAGVIADNSYISLLGEGGQYTTKLQGGNVKDCYSNLRTITNPYLLANLSNKVVIAGAIGKNTDKTHGTYTGTSLPILQNYLLGTYYNKDNLNYVSPEDQAVTTKTFKGLGVMSCNEALTFKETKGTIFGLTYEEMKDDNMYLSHKTKDLEFDEEGSSTGIIDKNVLWLFDTVWAMAEDVNDGMPYLNYQLIYIPDDFRTVGVPVIKESYYEFIVEYQSSVTIISQSNGKLSLYVGEAYNLEIRPKNLKVSWEVADSNIASVDSNGKITAKKVGVTTVTASTTSGSSDTITVIVEDIVYTIYNYPESLTMKVGETYNFSGIGVIPDITTLEYSTESEAYAVVVDARGKIQAVSATPAGSPTYVFVKAGKTQVAIPLTILSGSSATPDKTQVSLTVNPTNITGVYSSIAKSGQVRVTAIDGISSDVDKFNYTYSSNSITVLNINNNGNYTILAPGSGCITVNAVSKTNSNLRGSAKVYFTIKNDSSVVPSSPTFTLTKNSVNIYKGNTFQITYNSNTPGTVTYSSYNTSIATVSGSGLITAVGTIGNQETSSCIITAKYVTAVATLYDYITVNVSTLKQATLTLSDSVVYVTAGNSASVVVSSNDVAGTFSSSYSWDGTGSTPASTSSETTSTTNKYSISTGVATLGTYTLTIKFLASNNTTASASVKFIIQPYNLYSQYIYNAEQLNAVRYHLDKTFYICANISLSGYSNWEPIGSNASPFTGSITNQGSYKITGLNVNDAYYAGLFGYTSRATIQGIIVSDSKVSGTQSGAIVGCASSSNITSCQSSGNSITGKIYAGGIVGCISDRTAISQCSSVAKNNVNIQSSSLTGSKYVGGIVGRAINSTITKVKTNSSGRISLDGGVYGYAGGVAGYTDSSINTAYVSTNVSTDRDDDRNYAGGIVGYTTGTITDAIITSTNITGYNVGGIGGSINVNYSITLKFSTYKKGYRYEDLSSTLPTTTHVSKVAVKDSVNVSGVAVGGLFGIINSGIVSNCYTRAELNGVSKSAVKGGFASVISSTGMKNSGGTGSAGIVDLCYSACTFTGSGDNHSVTSSYVFQYYGNNESRVEGYIFRFVFDNDLDGKASYKPSSNLFGSDYHDAKKSSSEMKKSETYKDKGFSASYWSMSDGSYPTLLVESKIYF